MMTVKKEPIVKNRRESAFESKTLELKLVDKNKIKRAAINLNKMFNANSVSISEETNILPIVDQPQGVDVTSFLYNLQQLTKQLTCQSFPKSWVNLIHQLTWFIILT